MADHLCGPSTGAQKLVNTLNRDRSLYLDGVSGHAAAGPSSAFRRAPAAEKDEHGPPFMTRPSVPDLPVGIGSVAPYVGNAVGNHANNRTMLAHNVATQVPGPMLRPPTAASNNTVIGGPGTATWVSQFNNLSLLDGYGQSLASAPMAGQPAANTMPINQTQPMAMNQGPYHQAPAYAPYAQANPGAAYMHHYALAGQAQPMMAMPTMHQQPAAIDRADFDAAFDQFDPEEMQKEMDAFILEGNLRATQPPTEAEWREIDKNLEEMAQDLELRRRCEDPEVLPQVGRAYEKRRDRELKAKEDEALVRHASLLRQALADNPENKYRASNFFALLDCIKDRKVTIVDNNFVVATTGEVYMTTDPEKLARAKSDPINADSVGYDKVLDDIREQVNQRAGR